MQDDGAIAAELLSYSKRKAAQLPLRLKIGRALLVGANNPRLPALLAEQIADRLEGSPVQKVKSEGSHTTVFYKAGDPLPWLADRAAPHLVDHRPDCADAMLRDPESGRDRLG